jgi:hypothetical protein
MYIYEAVSQIHCDTATEIVFLKETGYHCNGSVAMKARLEESILLHIAIVASVHF